MRSHFKISSISICQTKMAWVTDYAGNIRWIFLAHFYHGACFCTRRLATKNRFRRSKQEEFPRVDRSQLRLLHTRKCSVFGGVDMLHHLYPASQYNAGTSAHESAGNTASNTCHCWTWYSRSCHLHSAQAFPKINMVAQHMQCFDLQNHSDNRKVSCFAKLKLIALQQGDSGWWPPRWCSGLDLAAEKIPGDPKWRKRWQDAGDFKPKAGLGFVFFQWNFMSVRTAMLFLSIFWKCIFLWLVLLDTFFSIWNCR